MWPLQRCFSLSGSPLPTRKVDERLEQRER